MQNVIVALIINSISHIPSPLSSLIPQPRTHTLTIVTTINVHPLLCVQHEQEGDSVGVRMEGTQLSSPFSSSSLLRKRLKDPSREEEESSFSLIWWGSCRGEVNLWFAIFFLHFMNSDFRLTTRVARIDFLCCTQWQLEDIMNFDIRNWQLN